jgi:hypothetical protein
MMGLADSSYNGQIHQHCIAFCKIFLGWSNFLSYEDGRIEEKILSMDQQETLYSTMKGMKGCVARWWSDLWRPAGMADTIVNVCTTGPVKFSMASAASSRAKACAETYH